MLVNDDDDVDDDNGHNAVAVALAAAGDDDATGKRSRQRIERTIQALPIIMQIQLLQLCFRNIYH